MENTNNLFERLEILTKPENIETTFFIILKFIIFIIILMIGALIVLGILNSRRNYNPEKIWNKKKFALLNQKLAEDRNTILDTGSGKEIKEKIF
ncbi:hypothetical protein Q1L79_11850 [Staphylococcus haemolyticus]|uniref:hypothetical protein n=1 Tax=Staphylococcus haemolyticus TaxID=1283 RepID=UPI00265C7552|nr:hypothetical protein [Staphylococcus haemolyticus]MDO0967641.1 hypothetical protein [Staphylococcus haemolyticus]